MDDYVKHSGTKRHSGRYPWGSGKEYTASVKRSKIFLDHVEDLRKQGFTEKERADAFGVKTTQLRAQVTIAREEKWAADAAFANRLADKGYSNRAIGERMGGINESSVRNFRNATLQERTNITRATANMLKETILNKIDNPAHGAIDIGVGVERHVGVSRTKLKTSISMLEEEGYNVHHFQTPQLGTGKNTSILALAPPAGSNSKEEKSKQWKEINKNLSALGSITGYSEDKGRSYTSVLGLKPIENIDSKRLKVRYGSDGGNDKDGVIELRRGVEDIYLGNSKYAQVRIGVDGTHFLKGMAIYGDKFPPGVDIIFNTNKEKDVPILGPKDNTILKPMKKGEDGKIDKDNPFGSTLKVDSDGSFKQKRALNIVNEEGDWGEWSKSISSQILSKQRPSLAKTQLEKAINEKKDEFDELNSLTNPVIKRKLLESFADECDSASTHLKAAALPRQRFQVILPIPTLKENEIYAPNFRNGERVALFRHPHGGIFEIPELTVNNNHAGAKKVIPSAIDAVGIHPKVAQKLSGADFDGDNVLVVPNNNGLIKSSPILKGLQDFDPKIAYPAFPGMPKPGTKGSGFVTGSQMGSISNLITDMTIKYATIDEIAKAVRHSMVVIDAEKHNLNYKQSAIDNEIANLKKKYQGGANKGASTLISRASSRADVRERTLRKAIDGGPIDKKTGAKVWVPTNESYTITRTTIDKNGKKNYEPVLDKNGNPMIKYKTTRTTKMDLVKDAHDLSSGTQIETIYGNHANSLKALSNQARKVGIETPLMKYSPSAKVAYANEVSSLNSKLNIALMNAPLERKAQLIANAIVSMKKENNPHMEADELKKVKNQALATARTRIGAKKHQIIIEPKEWDAIQSGAISSNVLSSIIKNSDTDVLKQLAMPRTKPVMSTAKATKAKAMFEAGRTQAEIADALGVSIKSISNLINV